MTPTDPRGAPDPGERLLLELLATRAVEAGTGLEDWRAFAACAEVDPEEWFPDWGQSARKAKAVCRTCPVRPECLDWALNNAPQEGVWGGLTERERRPLRLHKPDDTTDHAHLPGQTATAQPDGPPAAATA